MSPAAWERAVDPMADRFTVWAALAMAAGAFLFLIDSQFWVYPLLGETFDASSGGLLRLIYMPSYAAAVVLAAFSPGNLLKSLIRQPFLVGLMLLIVLSTLWSASPDQTLRRVVAIYFSTLGGLALAARFTWARLCDVLAACFAGLIVLSAAVALLLPSMGVMHELFPGAWRGVWNEKNALGGNMAFGFVVLAAAAILNPPRARLWGAFAVLALGLVLMSTSKTSLVSLLLGAGALVFVILARRGPAAGVAMVWLAVVMVGLGAALALFASDVVFEVLGKDATLTGRTRIWSAAMRQIAERPWTGFGYGAVWDETGAWGPLAWIKHDAAFTPKHAHNSWLEQWLGLGVFGLLLFGLTYVQTLLLAALSIFRSPGAYLAVPFLAVYSLMTITESIAVTYHDFRWVMFVAIAAKLVLGDDPEPGV